MIVRAWMANLGRGLTGVLVGMLCVAQVQAAPTLFRDWRYDDPVTRYTQSQGFSDCSEAIGESARCISGVEFMDGLFEGVLLFERGRLQTVTLMRDFDESLYHRLMSALNSNFTLLFLQGSDEDFDVLAERHAADDGDVFAARISRFESSQLSSGMLAYVFLQQPIDTLRRYQNYMEAILNTALDTRGAELMVLQDEAGMQMMVSFNFPARMMQALLNQQGPSIDVNH